MNIEKQIQKLENTIHGYDKLLSDPELGKMAVQYKKESMERIELWVTKVCLREKVWTVSNLAEEANLTEMFLENFREEFTMTESSSWKIPLASITRYCLTRERQDDSPMQEGIKRKNGTMGE
ncbi:hypothetical protein TNIN_10331 [Trichonephila inaurata madagascariensis]|uniref:Uncharacterized protein n=1 Tax=Trichonephila inaurata madagascariensis TaxID=2747483 RepID=A0A8X7BVA3_9ARAC|nr:hypothetical protein TNIN_10331 [Trichonephila inaurata madagascariensis]